MCRRTDGASGTNLPGTVQYLGTTQESRASLSEVLYIEQMYCAAGLWRLVTVLQLWAVPSIHQAMSWLVAMATQKEQISCSHPLRLFLPLVLAA